MLFNDFYKQNFVLPIRSPLSDVIPCIFLEFRKSSPIQNILCKWSAHIRHIDDTHLIYNRDTDLPKHVEKLNRVDIQ